MPRYIRSLLVGVLVLMVGLLAARPAAAVQPKSWAHTTEADFDAGQKEGVVVTNLGDVKLASDTRELADLSEQTAILNDLCALPNGDVYLAAGPDGKLLRRRGEEVATVAEFEGEQVFALDRLGDALLVAISAEGGSRLAVLRDEELVTVLRLEDVRYIWDLAVIGNDVYLATGTDGKVLVAPDLAAHVPAQAPNKKDKAGDAGGSEKSGESGGDGEAGGDADKPADQPETRVVLDAAQPNVLCLAWLDGDGKDGPTLYAGTDGEGLVYRVGSPGSQQPEAFVLYDAAEPEIGALYVADDGTVYAGTADAEQARPGRLAEATREQAGRPELPGSQAAEDGDQGQPKPGDLPQVPPDAPPIGGEGNDGDDAPSEHSADTTDSGKAVTKGSTAAPAAPHAVHAREAEKMLGQRPDAVAMQASPQGVTADEAVMEEETPSESQHDALRAEIRRRLETARRSGTLQGGPSMPMRRAMRGSAPGGPRPGPTPSDMGGARQEGNAIYRISPQGFVTEVFRESVMVLRIVAHRGKLLAATGNEGQLFQIDPDAQETTILADLEAQQIPALLSGPDGVLLVGAANPAALLTIGDGFAATGIYTSAAQDAAQISLWGKLKLTRTLPSHGKVRVETRSGNVADPEEAAWSPWATAEPVADDEGDALTPRDLRIASPPARFLQYRLNLEGGDGATPVVDRVEIAYVTPNLKPAIASLSASYPQAPSGSGGPGAGPASGSPGEASPSPAMTVTWEASDPNGDALRYSLEYQPAGSPRWLSLAKDLTDTTYEWPTQRVPDGRYLLRVTATDAADNPAGMAMTATRRSDPVLVDNTPPVLEHLTHARAPQGGLTVAATAKDALSPIRRVSYAVDAEEQFQPILPDDLIYDSTAEAWTITIPALAPGSHVVTLRVSDSRGNTTHVPILVDGEKR